MARRDVLAWVIARTIWGEALWSRDQMEECYRIADAVTPVFTQTDDGAAVAAQSMGGSLPPAVPSSLTGGEEDAAETVPGVGAIGHLPGATSSPSPSGPGPAATIGGQPGPIRQPRLFELYRHRDVTGQSGVGTVAWGTEWPDGTAVLRWITKYPSTVHWESVAAIAAVHGHDGATEIRWVSTDVPIDLWPAEGGNRG